MPPDPTRMTQGRKSLALVLFLVVVLGVGLSIGFVTRPTEWYASLAKPPFNPPNWIFAPTWTVIYILVAIAGWRTWLVSGIESIQGRARMVQMLLNWLWSPVFFGLHQMWWGLVVIVALLASIVTFLATTRDRIAFWTFVPYAAWVSFATLLNLSLAMLN